MASASSAVYAGSTRMPLATPKATISGTGPPAAATAARPASSPACVPPLELACTTDRGRSPAASHWRWSSTNAAREPDRAHGRAATDRDGEGPPPAGPQLLGQGVLRDLEGVPGRHPGEVQLGAEEARQELVAGRLGRGVAAQHQVDGPAEASAGRRGHAAVVGLAGADRDQRVRAVRLRRAAQELQLPGLVPTHAEAGEVVALDPQPGAAGQHRSPLQRRGQRGQRHPGWRGQGPVERLEGRHVV